MKKKTWPPCWLHDQTPDAGFRGHKMLRVYFGNTISVSYVELYKNSLFYIL